MEKGISGSMDRSDLLEMFPDDVTLKRLCRMRKQMEILETSWANHLERRDAAEQMLDDRGEHTAQTASFINILEDDHSDV